MHNNKMSIWKKGYSVIILFICILGECLLPKLHWMSAVLIAEFGTPRRLLACILNTTKRWWMINPDYQTEIIYCCRLIFVIRSKYWRVNNVIFFFSCQQYGYEIFVCFVAKKVLIFNNADAPIKKLFSVWAITKG